MMNMSSAGFACLQSIVRPKAFLYEGKVARRSRDG